MKQKDRISFSAACELIILGFRIMLINNNPFDKNEASRTDKVLSAICKLSDLTFHEQAMAMISGVDTLGQSKYGNTYSEVDAILEKHPKFKEYRALIIGRVNVCRKNKKLAV